MLVQKIRELRIKKKLTQTQVSEKIHLCQNTYSLFESGKYFLDNSRLIKLAEILEVNPSELLSEDELVILRKICGIENKYNINAQLFKYQQLVKDYQQLLEMKEIEIKNLKNSSS